jgi:hypothetical protein
MPNTCSATMCALVSSLPDPQNHRFVTPTFSATGSSEGSVIKAEFENVGSITITDLPPSEMGPAKPDVVVSAGCDERRCRTLSIIAKSTSAGRTSAALACEVHWLWLVRPEWHGRQPTSVELAYAHRFAFRMAPSGACAGARADMD